MNRLRDEDGFTLPELLVGAMLMIIVMMATLSVLDQFTQITSRADDRVNMQDRARQTGRQLARSLRNAAASPELTAIIERAEPDDLVFLAVDRPRAGSAANTRNLRRVRYCLGAGGSGGAKLVEQTQRWNSAIAPGVPPSSACPAPGWTADKLVAEGLTNHSRGTARPLWTYGRTAAGQITAVTVNLFMKGDSDTAQEVALQTGVYLRNQNRSPSALFSADPTGLRHVLLNGSTSSDPEGDPLDYHWFVNGVEVGRGLIFDYAASTGGTYSFSLEVRDPSGLRDRSASQTVVLP
jgi:type II secretory pathway pseudopilin PulG